jgi:hypothetical protein
MADSRTRVVIAYAIWAGICAVIAGVLMAIIHTAFFSYVPSRTAFMSTLLGGIATTSAIAAGQAAVILATGGILARRGFALQGTVLLGLLIGAFDFFMNLLQLLVPALEPGWTWDLAILAVATVGITLLGARRAAAAV